MLLQKNSQSYRCDSRRKQKMGQWKGGMEKKEGYHYGISPGFQLYELCSEMGVKELTLYGFTTDNTKRPAVQKEAFQKACVDAVMDLVDRNAELLVIGNTDSPCFP